MTRWATRLGVSAAFACSAILVAQQRPPVFRGGAVLVTVDVYPQRDGRVAEGLTAADFQILEDGKPQKIENLEFVRVEPGPEAARRDPNTQRESLELASDPHNRVFIAFLDALHTAVDGSHNIRAPLVDTLNRIVAPNDLFGVMTQNVEARHLVLGRRTLSVEEQLTRYWPWGERNRITSDPTDPAELLLKGCFHSKPLNGGWVDWIVLDEGVKRFLDEVLVDRRREDRTLTSLEDLVTYLSDLREARTVIILISDGWLQFEPNQALANESAAWTEPAPPITIGDGGRLGIGDKLDNNLSRTACNAELIRLAQMDDRRRLRDLVQRANRANVSIYPVTPSGLTAWDTPIDQQRLPVDRTIQDREGARIRNRLEGLRMLADNTDGLAIVETNDLATGMRKIVNDTSAYYLLGYYSTNLRNDGRYRRIHVTSGAPGLEIRARRGYFAPTETSGRPGTRAMPTTPVSAVPPAIAAALGSLSKVGPNVHLYTNAGVFGGDLTIAVELSSSQMILNEAWASGADVDVVVTTASGDAVGSATGRVAPATRGVFVKVPVGASEGPWRVATTARSGAVHVEDRVDVRPVTSRLVADPWLFRATPAPASPLRAVADFQYRRTERVHVEWPVVSSLDRREARLLDRIGAPLPVPVNLTERASNGRQVVAADLNLAPLSAGDYVIELTVGSGTATETRLLAIRVIP